MSFRTEINPQEIQKPQVSIDYASHIGLMGSCFVEHVGHRLKQHQFNTLLNPYGILFHPLAIEKALKDIQLQKQYEQKDLIYDQGLWHSPHHHSDFSHPQAEVVLQKIHQMMEQSHLFLQKATHFILTLGTAWVYHHVESDQLVANCHKIPQKHFIKRLLSIAEISKSLQNSIQILHAFNPNMQIVLTVSPVRHLKDGMQNNALSKAHLLSAIHEVTDGVKVYYFPSYEMLMDDLRDYRFYNSDWLHPNETAVQYVWEVFQSTWMETHTLQIMQKIAQLQRDLNHRPFHPDSDKHLKFLEHIEKQKRELKVQYGIDYPTE